MSVNFRHMALFGAMVLSMGASMAQKKELVILHTNDSHSQIEPNSPTASSHANQGGVVRRAVAIEQARSQSPDLILVDAGDFVQGSPYYNFFKGEVEIKMMNKLGYNVGTLGNHEFDNGIDDLVKMLQLAEFPIICANYDVTGTPLEPYVKPTVILDRDGLKIGFIGLGVNPEGLIAKKNFGDIKYLNPSETANKYASELKKAGCDLIVVVSHI
ncbi:MAG: bifunctional metallophosphatase/5'-nucleotidase, partial [Bacteroidales bacterium]